MSTSASLALIVWALVVGFVVAPQMVAPEAEPSPPAAVIDCDGQPFKNRPPVVVKPKVTE